MSIAKRKTTIGQDRFDVLYRGPDGREHSKTFRTRTDARAFESEQRVAMRKGVWTDPKAGRVTLTEWSAEWRSTVVHLAASSNRIHADNLRLHVLPDVVGADGKVLARGLGAHELGKLTTAQLTKWVAAMSVKPKARQPKSRGGKPVLTMTLAPASVHQAYRTLHLCLEAAVTCGHLGRNPLDGVKPPRIELQPMRFLDAGEVERLADAIDQRYRALVMVAAYCGLRAGELMALRWENVDLANRSIRVTEQTDADRGLGAVKPPKTAAGRRSVPIPSFVTAALVEHGRMTQPDGAQAGPDRPGDGTGLRLVTTDTTQAASTWRGLVFASAEGGPLHLSNFRRRVWEKAVTAAGLDALRIHDLRHTCASLAIQAGADVKALQRMLGQASAAVTLDRYGHLMPGQVEAVADRMDVLRQAAIGA